MKRYIPLLVLAVAIIAVAAYFLTGSNGTNMNKTAAISFQGGDQPIWKRHGSNVKSSLEDSGFTVDLQFAETEQAQIEQIDNMISQKPGCIIIGAVNGTALSDVLKRAGEEGIPVIAFDRLIMNTPDLSYYVSFDNEGVGNAMGQYIEAALNLRGGAGPYNIEFFAGDPNDNNAHLFFSGSMDILKPYLDNGQLVCRSKETDFDRAATANWDGKNATVRMEKLMKTYYADGAKIDVVLSPNDGVAEGIRNGLANAGYADIPILTGQDCDDVAMKALPENRQAMSIYKNPEQLAAKCVRMVKAVVEGTEPIINDVKSYNNGAKTIPSYLCIPLIIDKTNLEIGRAHV